MSSWREQHLTEIINKTLSTSKDGIITTTYADDGSVEGIGHNMNGIETLTGGQGVNFLIDLSSVPAESYIFVLPIIVTTSLEDVTVKLYENTDYSGGTNHTTFNVNRNISNNRNFVITKNATGATKGTAIRQRFISANFFHSGTKESITFLIFNTSMNYLFEIVNSGSITTTVTYDALIFET